ncbi:MAG TPA: efflux RND transporter periplasmic adaptor subunit [Phycisphaerales bacterium]|nr:efflux RND transporter periplasmic adaptor subunit [Phycisphaerales bacterium]
MKRFMTGARSLGAWLWQRTSAAVAVVLIVAAFAGGYRLARPTPEPRAEESAGASEPAGDGRVRMYTCSMHPQIRLPDPKAKCPICFMDLIPVTDDADGEGGGRRLALSAEAAALSRVETAVVRRFFPVAEVRLYGKVAYDETSVARLTAYFPGRIERLFVNYVGVPVNRGDHLAEMYSPELLAAFEELRQTRAAAEGGGSASDLLRRATEDTLRAAREKLRLFGLTAEQVAGVESGEFVSDRLTVFAPIGGVVTGLAVREGDYVMTGAPLATVADLSRLWLDLGAYESQLPLLRWGQRVRFTVEAHPGEVFEGRISFIEPVVKDDTRTATVRVAVDNADRHLKPGMFASAVVRPRVAEDGAVVGDELAGRWVSPMHPTVVKDGPGQCDICGMDLVPAESLGVVGDPAAAVAPLVVPRSAVLFTGTRSVVYVEVEGTERPTYEGREVVLGPRAGEFYTVREGLREGESVVVHGAFRIDSAMQIAARPSMMSPEGGEAGSPVGHEGHGASAPARVRTPDLFLFGLKPVYAAYLDAQESLAADDIDGFNRAADDVRRALDLVREAGLVGEPLGAWRRAAARLRQEGRADSPDDARERFRRMSEGVIDLQRRFGHLGSETWHLAFCPMAFDNRGAEWVQRTETIANPYFGAAMLRCGEVRDRFAPLERGEGEQ